MTASSNASHSVKTRAVAVVNPKAGRGAAFRLWQAREPQLRQLLPSLSVVMTERRGHATELTRAALTSGANLVLSVGGDGTNNEVLSGFVDARGENAFPEAELALLPGGRGCDFTRSFGSLGFGSWLERLGASARPIDYGVVGWGEPENFRCFLNLASLGASSSVLGYVNEARGWFGAELTYLGASVRTILTHKNQGIRIQYDAEPIRELEAAIVCVANGRYFGAGIHVNPRGKVDDGLFDIIEVSGTSRLQLMNVLRRAQSGRHIEGSAHVLHRTCRSVKVWSTATQAEQAESWIPRFETDGEIVAAIPASFRIIPGGIRIRGL